YTFSCRRRLDQRIAHRQFHIAHCFVERAFFLPVNGQCAMRDGQWKEAVICAISTRANLNKIDMDIIDLRSDTVTKPTPAMRRAMAEAEVGDDVYLEDPTVNRLQERAAEILGKEAALFVPSGTMGNQICVRLNARPGTEVVVEARSHIFNYEMGAA